MDTPKAIATKIQTWGLNSPETAWVVNMMELRMIHIRDNVARNWFLSLKRFIA